MARIVLEPLTTEQRLNMFENCGVNIRSKTPSRASERICRLRDECRELRKKILNTEDDDVKKDLVSSWSFLQCEILLYEGWIRFLSELSNHQ